ncbi:MAG: hypothetical protein IPK80_19440 [Nannocystis sp.]|nr:hypothetical protein [Nannocystis sp.]
MAFGLQAQIKGQSAAVEEKVYPVPFTLGKSDPHVHTLFLPKESALTVRLRNLGARPTLAGAFEAGAAKRALLRRPCEPLVDQLVASLTELLGVPPRARVEAEPTEWPSRRSGRRWCGEAYSPGLDVVRADCAVAAIRWC